MRIAYLDTIAGISGDMTLGAFVDAGVPVDVLAGEIQKLKLHGVELTASHVRRNGITAVKVDVVISVGEGRERSLRDILKIIDASGLSPRVKHDAEKIFQEVARAEARIHNTPIEKIHFHEVGMLDSIVDIVGAAICFEQLGVERIFSSPIKVGNGSFVDSAHGKLPIPGPAAIEILKDYPVVLTDVSFELTTPTGAAIVKAMSSGVLTSQPVKFDHVGYGAGSREIPHIPNLLRVMVGDLMSTYEEDDVVSVETNIDDMNPEVYPFVLEQLFSSGAHDAYMVPIVMKKGRPGILLSALVGRSKLDDILKIFFTQTTTLGVRIQSSERKKLQRFQREVVSQYGNVMAKVIIYDGRERLVPEFEECRRIATKFNIPLLNIYRALDAEFLGGEEDSPNAQNDAE